MVANHQGSRHQGTMKRAGGVSSGSSSSVTTHRGRQQVCLRKRKDPAGYSNAAVGAIGRTPSDVFLFSKLPEADQQPILRQATPEEFDRYIGHAHMKLRKPMRDERAGKQTEAAASMPSFTPA